MQNRVDCLLRPLNIPQPPLPEVLGRACDIGPSHVALLTQALEANTTVTIMDMALNRCGETGAESVAMALARPSSRKDVAIALSRIYGFSLFAY